MLQAKDLRYGNRVLNSQGKVITVQQILYSSIVYDTEMKINNALAVHHQAYPGSYTSEVIEVIKEADLQDIEPIPITPSVLLACGFRNFKREDWIVSYGKSYADFELNADGLRLRHPTPSHMVITHLHQLQNFFYALTGYELTVNL